ncbi:hypothetical protein SAMN05192558_104195 [Actinokineospora alba]|uniref:Secreted protein n=1 Tax=Actinokineospora alba TaxID=504798 RepID=A0A1H0LLH6_9PSEU|nr:hypothetical protein [Actinokineospora alba]TDP67371.1 hypothetical protein C8E96_2913 [Actinokineospora alba]SDI98586.1 hypothetical protein SAMN05421871_109102 [Actinokineospora alba]SDO69079.1 hypothetical protein SAMN05192558_104195 [Actinokineospora alba]
MRRLAFVLSTIALLVGAAPQALADAPARVRVLTCSDGTTFTGEQVRFGGGAPPRTWRNVVTGEDPVAFVFFASSVTAPDGTVVENVTWDHSQGVDRNRDLVTCGFVIPEGPFIGHAADFVGYFIGA